MGAEKSKKIEKTGIKSGLASTGNQWLTPWYGLKSAWRRDLLHPPLLASLLRILKKVFYFDLMDTF